MGSDSPAQPVRREADPSEPVGRHEFLLRRIHRIHYEERPKDPIKSTAFHPTKDDSDGLSVFRQSFCTVSRVFDGARTPPH